MTTPSTKPHPALHAALVRLAEAAGDADIKAYRSALRTAEECGASWEQIVDAFLGGQRFGLNLAPFDAAGDVPPF